MYDVSAWSLPMAYDITAYWSADRSDVSAAAVDSLSEPAGSVHGGRPAYGFLFDCRDDRAPHALSMLLAGGFRVRSAREPFRIEGRSYGRGAVLLRLSENPDTLYQAVERVADAAGITIHSLNTALSTEGPDLGGNDFVLLREPRIALIGGPEVSTTSFGSLWHLLDHRMQIKHTILNTQFLGSADLRKYNAIVFPSTWSPQSYRKLLGKDGLTTEQVENGVPGAIHGGGDSDIVRGGISCRRGT